MSLRDRISNFINPRDYEEEEYDDNYDYDQPEGAYDYDNGDSYSSYEEPAPRRSSYSSSRSSSNVVDFGSASQKSNQLQVVAFQPTSYTDDTKKIADAILQNCSVIINLEKTDPDSYLRLLTFISGVVYARHAEIKNIAAKTFLITPANIDVSGEFVLNELDQTGISF